MAHANRQHLRTTATDGRGDRSRDRGVRAAGRPGGHRVRAGWAAAGRLRSALAALAIGSKTAVARSLAACAILLAAAGAAQAELAGPVPPLGPGPFAVGCSNIEQDFSRVPAGDSPQSFWDGASDGRYVTDLLVDPAHAFVVQQTNPDDFEHVRHVCRRHLSLRRRWSAIRPTAPIRAPTTCCRPATWCRTCSAARSRPIFPGGSERFPVLLFSHGLSGQPDRRRLHRGAEGVRELRLRRRRAVPRRPALRRHRARQPVQDVVYALLHFQYVRRDAGGAAALAVGGARSPCSRIRTFATTSMPRASAASARASAASRCC